MEFALRSATIDDKEFLYQLNKSTMSSHVERIWGSWDDAWQRDNFDKKFTLEGYDVIDVDGRNAGALWVSRETSQIKVERLHILSEFQGRGIGTRILRNLIREASDQSREIVLSVLRTNTRAKSLYERLGFEEIGNDGNKFHMKHFV
ncbi:GNAT family N-acetyltransferase [Candidatus Nomurabacteria bacterium]|nr:GNAT family N-acetyltransferase [Candidatus Nomurabacteria bacterium]